MYTYRMYVFLHLILLMRITLTMIILAVPGAVAIVVRLRMCLQKDPKKRPTMEEAGCPRSQCIYCEYTLYI